MARLSFDTVLQSLDHEDDKANRLIIAMAFIAAAAAAIFNKLFTPDAHKWGDFDAAAISFGIFMGLIALGSLSVLAALGPKFHIPSKWKEKGIPSRLFFQHIAGLSEEKWRSHLSETPEHELQRLYEKDLVLETWLLAQKNDYKVFMLSLGAWLFKHSFIALGLYLAVDIDPGFLSSTGWGIAFAALVFFHDVSERLMLPENQVEDGNPIFIGYLKIWPRALLRMVPYIRRPVMPVDKDVGWIRFSTCLFLASAGGSAFLHVAS